MADPLVTARESGEITTGELAAAGDRERVRWYAEGGESCMVLTERGLLLEPAPTFGPLAYRRIMADATFAEAERLATAAGYVHLRRLP